MFICGYVDLHIFLNVCMYVCVYIYICINVYVIYIYVKCIYVLMYVCIYVYVFICVYAYMYICYIYVNGGFFLGELLFFPVLRSLLKFCFPVSLLSPAFFLL